MTDNLAKGRDELEEWSRAIEEGYQAGKNGLDPRFNPYPKMSSLGRTWDRWHGYGTILYEMKKKEGRVAG